jgi:ADP-heptose:LPS heptosyltransferase
MKINETSSVIVDLSEDLALGDTVLRIGALKTLHRNCRELYVISHRADLLRDSGIQNIISYSDVAKLLASIDFVVRPASWIGNSKKFWSEISLDNKTGFIDGLLDCRHDYDIEQIRNNPRYFNPERSVINRVHKNFVSQLREFTEFDIGLCDVVHGMTAHAIASNLSKEYYGSPEHSHDKILAIADSSSISSKSWPHFADLVNRLNAMRPDLKYAFVSKDSAFDSEKIKSLNNPQSVVYSAARDDIKESWNVMKQCFAFLGNDSGPGHYYSMIHS